MQLFENAWNHFEPQFREFVQDKLEQESEGSLLTGALSQSRWWDAQVFRNAKFWHDQADMTLVGWISAMDCFAGDAEGDKFSEYLRSRLKVMVLYEIQARRDYPYEQQMMDAECERELERVV